MTQTHAAPQSFLSEDKSLACIHCGLCLGSCPTYLETGNENDSPRGRIYLMRNLQSGRAPLEAEVVRHLDLCLGCRACEVACPSGVHYGELLEESRDFIEKNYSRSLHQTFLRRVAIEKIFPFPRRMRWVVRAARLAKALGGEKWLPKFAREGLALIPARRRQTDKPSRPPAPAAPRRGRVGFIDGCVMPVLFAETNQASIELLEEAGFSVVSPRGQGCCGALFSHGGNLEEARACARRNIAAFEAENLDAIIINAAGCGSTLKEYGHLLENDPAWAERGKAFSAKVKDLTEFLVQNGSLPRADSPEFETVTYHDACHLAHAQKITAAPRTLVKARAGDRFVPLPESEILQAGNF